MSSIIDHHVTRRDEGFLETVAVACRKIGTRPGSNYVDLQIILDELQAHGVESIFSIIGVKRKGRLKIEVIEDDPYEFPAFVKFHPTLTLFVQSGTWRRFNEGQSKERIIIAHEIGHIMLHDNEAKPFARLTDTKSRFSENEYYAEWQADRIADYLLIPTLLALQLDDVDRISFTCNVTDEFAAERLKNVRNMKKVLNPQLTGGPCPDCGDFSLLTKTMNRSCNFCGYVETMQGKREVLV